MKKKVYRELHKEDLIETLETITPIKSATLKTKNTVEFEMSNGDKVDVKIPVKNEKKSQKSKKKVEKDD